jgi:alkylated DNA repair protein alkB family protein 8
MEFKHPEGEHINVYVPPRSLMLMSKESRLLWSHGITPRKTDILGTELVPRQRRISLTFRQVRPIDDPCTCAYYAQCDRWRESLIAPGSRFVPGAAPGEKAPTAPSIIEAQYVYDTYNKIAPEFSKTRYKPWPSVKKFLEGLPSGSFVADVGSSYSS